MAAVRSPRARSAFTSSRNHAAIICETRSSRSCKAARSTGTSAHARIVRPAERASRRRCNSRDRPAGGVTDLERALDPLRVVRVDAGRGFGIELAELRMQRRPAFARGPLVDRSAQLRRRLGQVAMPAQRAQVEHRSANEQRNAAAGLDSSMRGQRHRARTARRNSLARLADVDQVMRHALAQLREGLAVPISSPRYTSAESTLTISSGSCREPERPSRVLPVPVGPVEHPAPARGRTHGSPTPQEQLIELRPATGASRSGGRDCTGWRVGRFHLAQQGVHLGQRQPAMRVDRGAAGERAEKLIRGTIEMMRARLHLQISHDGAHDLGHLLPEQQRRHGAQAPAASAPSASSAKPALLPLRAILDAARPARPLSARPRSAPSAVATPGARDPLAPSAFRRARARARRACRRAPGRLGLRQDVDAVELRERDAQRLRAVLTAGCAGGADSRTARTSAQGSRDAS